MRRVAVRSRARTVFVPAVFVLTLIAASSAAQVYDSRGPVTDGAVFTSARAGDTVWIGGSFQHAGPNTGGFGALSLVTGARVATMPRVNGVVNAIAPDGAGGCFLGGSFTRVNGVPRQNLAHVRADGTLDGWSPGAANTVNALVVAGGRVIAGGLFRNAGGAARDRIAAFDAVSGALDAWNPGASNQVKCLAAVGDWLFVGGTFTTIGGQPRAGLASFTLSTGALRNWTPAVSPACLAISASPAETTLFVGGTFGAVGATARNNLAALDARTGGVRGWDPGPDGGVLSLLVDGPRLYVGGSFYNIGGIARTNLAAVDLATGAGVAAWAPAANGNVYAIAASGGTVYAGGTFTRLGGLNQPYLAAVSSASGAPVAWSAPTNAAAFVLCADSGRLLVGGGFSGLAMAARGNGAAMDLATGALLPWDPHASDRILELHEHQGRLFAGGAFVTIGGQVRNRLAELDPVTGAATGWVTGASAIVSSIAILGDRLYADGGFYYNGGASYAYLGAVDLATGASLSWNPSPQGWVYDLAAEDTTIVLASGAASIDGQNTNGFVRLGAQAGHLVAFPSPCYGSELQAILRADSTLYLGGTFTSLAGNTRLRIAAMNLRTGAISPWDPGATGTVRVLARDASHVWAAGSFTLIGGQYIANVAALDPVTGLALPWNSATSGIVNAIAPGEGDVCLGGSFTSTAGDAAHGFARLWHADAAAPAAAVVSPNGGEGLVTGQSHTLSWAASDDHFVESVDLWLSRVGPSGPWELLAAGVPNTSSWNWLASGPNAVGTAWLRVDARDPGGLVTSDVSDAPFSVADAATLDAGEIAREGFVFAAAGPNPGHGEARFELMLPAAGVVRVRLLDVQGREITRPWDGFAPAGRRSLACDTRGWEPGVYFARAEFAGRVRVRRVTVLR